MNSIKNQKPKKSWSPPIIEDLKSKESEGKANLGGESNLFGQGPAS